MKIIAAYQEVGTYRGAADICGTTHKTVKRVIERAEAGETAVAVRAERPRNYDPVAELVTTRVKSSEGRMSAKRLLPIAQAAGYDGSARNFRRLVAAQKALWRRDHHRGRRPAVWTPGEYLVIDWATVGGGLHLFCAVLAWSRWRLCTCSAWSWFVADTRWARGRCDGRCHSLPAMQRSSSRRRAASVPTTTCCSGSTWCSTCCC